MNRIVLIAVLLFTSSAVSPTWAEDDGDIDKLVQQLSSDDVELQRSALSRLRWANEYALPALPALVEIVNTLNGEDRTDALTILGNMGPAGKAAAQPLRDALKDPDLAVRIAAAYALLRIVEGDSSAVAVLGEALLHGDEDSRLTAARNIVYVGLAAKGAARWLAQAASDESAAVRAEVATALGGIGLAPRDPLRLSLKGLLADESPLVQVSAARSLWRLDEPAEALTPTLMQIVAHDEPVAARDAYTDLLRQDAPACLAMELLGQMGPEARPAVATLIAAAENPSLAFRFSAVDALGAIGPEAAPAIGHLELALRDTTSHSYPLVHRAYCLSDQAAVALRRIGAASTAALLSALDDNDPRVRANAATALGHLSQSKERTIPALVKLLDDRDESVRALAAHALGRFGPEAAAAAPNLAGHLNDAGEWTSYPGGGIGTRYTVGDHVLTALESISPKPELIVPSIVEALKKTRHISHAMGEMLRRLGPAAKAAVRAIEPLLGEPDESLPAAMALARIAPDHDALFESLRAALADSNKSPIDAARGLGDLGNKGIAALPELNALLDRQDFPSEKAIVAAAIVKIDRSQTSAIVELATGLRESEQAIPLPGHGEAAAIWAGLGDDARPALSILIDGLSYASAERPRHYYLTPQREAEIRLRSAELLIDVSVCTPPVVDALMLLCQSPDCGHRGMAADALGRIGSTARPAVTLLVRLLADREVYIVDGDFYGNGGTRFEPGARASLALAQIGAAAVPALRAALKSDQSITRQRAAESLGSIGKAARPALPELAAALNDLSPVVRAAAAEALGKIGDADSGSVVALVRALGDSRLAVRAAAATALGDLGPAAKECVPQLSKLQDDPYELARDAAKEALRKIGSE